MTQPATVVLIGLDDTDNRDSRGTGYLARQLSAECAARGMRPLGVTRHQFLVSPEIPYTSHNSGACVAVEGDGGAAAAEFAFDFVAARAADGSDPGVCVGVFDAAALDDESGAAPREVVGFGRAAGARILTMTEAMETARRAGLALRALGGTGLGVIGALASVGLRAGGNDGRFIDLPGLRDLPDRGTLAMFDRLGIRLGIDVKSPTGDRLPDGSDPFETLGWVRPRLLVGKPVLMVEWSDEHDAWVPVDRKHSQP